MRLVPWQPDDLVRRLPDVVAVYGEAMGYRKELLETRRGYIAAHVRRPGFRAVATLTTDGQLAGFGYGYTSAGGQWWHDQVRSALSDAERRTWLTDCFEVVELHVRPAAQGHRIGSRQLRALLAMAAGSTCLLSTPEADEKTSRAWRLYRGFGFIDVLRDFHFPGDERAFAVLGRELPLAADRRDAAPAAERA
ncbi:GNAT family N-acetyltransferase [Spirilliplanes yamanashiensis]|uniref:Acetyltransferase n=1 Tax=Spirilliplanes yamanashiensis TaxID=42233 RepID=A0A8J4DJ53_9ACTN|nr:GNAT family N-acetyltransferase [Spirilliplanes yamanashiensis]MDP9816913.1 ribosomal protein S18 acetylase RimI-like enzyme [Spirilliplanes yamanashiensis]GIJ03431.1 acetyltransferase [Spirilliplanes yamanashiensis]